MSRRFRNRHARVQAQPDAEPGEPLVLDDSNSFLDPLENIRKPLVLNARAYVQAGAADAAAPRKKARKV
jgi:hypothetical protein